MRELKRSETKVTKEYCWAMTQEAGRSCCGRSGPRVLQAAFQLYSRVQGDSVAKGPKLFTDNSMGPLATESPCIYIHSWPH